jgi:hypothetical protein
MDRSETFDAKFEELKGASAAASAADDARPEFRNRLVGTAALR